MFNTAIYDDVNERFRREEEEHQPTAVVRYICRHIFTDGRRCGSVCLRHEEFCYYHHTSRRPAQPKQRKRRSSTFNLPLIEDRASIQTSIAEVLRLVASNDLDPRRAGLLLYGLQIASSNMPRHASSRSSDPETPAEQVEQVILDPEIGPVAPPPSTRPKRKRGRTRASPASCSMKSTSSNA